MGFDTKVKTKYSQASFATKEEIYQKFPQVDTRDFESNRGGGIVISKEGDNILVDESDNSTLIIGSIGSKKTRNVVMPHIYSAAKTGTSMVIHAPKCDIYMTMKSYLVKQGYKIVVLDYRNPQLGNRYNPLEVAAKLYKAGNKDKARELFTQFAKLIYEAVKSEKDLYWHNISEHYFVGLAELLCIIGPAENCTIENIYNLHLQGDRRIGGSTYFNSYFEEHPDERCRKMIYPVITAPNDTRNTINSVFTSAITNFIQSDAVVDQAIESSINAEDLVNEKTALFIISRDEGGVYDALITTIIEQIYAGLSYIAEENGGSLPRKVTFFLDEFGNLPELTEIRKKITLSRARNITWDFVVQSLEQMSLVYGDKIAQVIIQNCNNIVYLFSPGISLVKQISELCGEKDSDENPGIRVPLCSVELLKHLDKDKGETLMLIDRMNPIITHLKDISEYCDIEPIEKIDIKKRKPKKNLIVDFKTVVEKIKKEKQQKRLHSIEIERMRELSAMRAQMDKDRTEDPDSVMSIINEVIYEIKGG